MSSLAWIDFDEEERQRARRIMALFSEKDTRDELGLGPVRDSIADILFPGTSTIQTRLRYMLFVPWIYQMVEEAKATPDRLKELARGYEISLIDALRVGGENLGVIGSEAGASLQRLPSSIYWNGLKSWGIRTSLGAQEAYFAALPSLRRRRHQTGVSEDGLAAEDQALDTWRHGMPPAPEGLLEATKFDLSSDEASFLIDRLVDAQPDSLLTHLARADADADCDYIWEHPARATFPEGIRRLVDHAEIFSAVMQGATLLYNLLLAELREHQDWIQEYRDEIEDWRQDLNLNSIATWQPDEFWAVTHHPDHRVKETARRFIAEWRRLVLEHGDGVVEDLEARDLVRMREARLKGAQSRFRNRSVLDKWGGRSGGGRLSFRWREASSHIRDLIHAK